MDVFELIAVGEKVIGQMAKAGLNDDDGFEMNQIAEQIQRLACATLLCVLGAATRSAAYIASGDTPNSQR